MENNVIEKARLDKAAVTELAAAHMKWLRFMIIAEAGIAIFNTALLLTGTILYGKEAVKILRKRMENQS